ncbi:CotH kinase family protein [Actinoplanes regularis]|uniref:Spore coat protein CotH n=1 Tax=Actinoplanes regularis TaxID=52697 RepID=A0A239JPY9_9ACTN|nr:CotH kinase family protein [Actinoplanes regularis]GIE92177.1 hypothetical protein Are01nite_86570 [Actinoplanes regularis]SNT08086.1 Spore coat protein CotH [Actinoplanes regularis]
MPGRRLVHRIPVRIRHYWRLLATCVAVVAALSVVFSTVRVAPLITSSSDADGSDVVQNVNGTKDLFDATVAHNIKLTYREADYQRLLDALWEEGEKEYLEADLTIDGTTVAGVGIRLKGNSTLSGLTRDGKARNNGFGGGRRNGGGQMPQPGGAGQLPGAGQQPGAAPSGAAPPAGGATDTGQQGGVGFGGRGMGGGFGAGLKAEEPEKLPWLISFDEFVEGRRYQGHREIAIRVSGQGGGSAVLNEALSLNVLAAAGQTAERYAYSSFTVNDRPTTARLVVEHPDKEFADAVADRTGQSGVLYKSLATSRFTDQGDDQTEYADDFKQINKTGSQDLEPVIKLIRWVSSASDSEFDAKLGEHVDVTAFAQYLAVQNLLVNFDDMSGPGRNYYLWYDLRSKKFTVVGWDYNLTLSGSAEQDPNGTVSMGGGGFPGGFPGGGDFQLPEGFEPPAGMQQPGQGGAPGGGGRGFSMGGNKLKERFLASNTFKAAYQDAYRDLYQQIYGSGAALSGLTAITQVLATIDGYDREAATSEAGKLRTLIQQRTEYLAGTDVIKGS